MSFVDGRVIRQRMAKKDARMAKIAAKRLAKSAKIVGAEECLNTQTAPDRNGQTLKEGAHRVTAIPHSTASRPIRIQRRRSKGWRMPPNTVYVGRPSRHGNKFAIGRHYRKGDGFAGARIGTFIYTEAYEGYQDSSYTTIKTNAEAVEWFRWYVTTWMPAHVERVIAELRGKDLVCWCPLDQPCHADILIEIANTEAVTNG